MYSITIRRSSFLVSSFCLALLAQTVSADSHDSAGVTEHQETVTVEQLKRETQELLGTLKGYGADQRDAAVKATGDAMQKLDQRIEKLQASIDKRWGSMSASAREESRERMDQLRAQRGTLSEWYEGMKTSSSNTWDEVKKGFGDTFSAAQSAWQKSRNEFAKEH